MGFNIAGFLINRKLENQKKLESVFGSELEYIGEVSGEDATMSKYDTEFDICTTDTGTLAFFEMGDVYDFSDTQGEVIQFIISDVSDTYYFEKYIDGKLERKLILSQGEISESEGSGTIDKDDDFIDKILEISHELLGIDDIFEAKFKRFKKAENSKENSSKNSKIGKTGKMLNLTTATCAMNIKPDKDQIKKFDEYRGKTNTIKYIVIASVLILAGLSVYLFQTGHWIFGSISAIITLLLLLFSLSIGNNAAYKSGLITAAIIIETKPIKIIALADMRSEEDQEKIILGCKKMTLKNLPNHHIKIGEKVPCVSLFSMAHKGYRQNFEPRPISWGYKNPDYIPEVIDFITNSSDYSNFKNDWEILEKLVETMTDVEKEEVVFFDEELNRVELEK